VTKLDCTEQMAPLANSPMKMSPSSMLARVMRPVSRITRSGTKLRITPTTAVRSESMNQWPRSITGATYPSSDETAMRSPASGGTWRSGVWGSIHCEFCS
jgi:hypothetical protein